MVSPNRSTVVVRRGGEPVLLHEIREHGAEGIGAIVEAAVLDGVKLFRR